MPLLSSHQLRKDRALVCAEMKNPERQRCATVLLLLLLLLVLFARHAQVVRTAYDTTVEGQSVVPTRGFGDLYYKQKKDDGGNLLAPALQVKPGICFRNFLYSPFFFMCFLHAFVRAIYWSMN